MSPHNEKLSQAFRLIAGDNPSKLIYENFRILVMELLRTQHAVDAQRRTPRDMKDNLSNITQAAKTLLKAMHDIEIVSYLNQTGPTAFNYLHLLIPSLEDVARRAEKISGALPNGPGRQRYDVGEFSINAMKLCVVIILESWNVEHEKFPSPYNENLWEAADLVWIESGGSSFVAENSLERWKKYFLEMSRTNGTTVRHDIIRQILDLRPVDFTKTHITEFGTE